MKYTYFHLMTKLCSLWHPCSIGKKLIQNLCYGLGIIHLAPVCRDWRRPSTWSRQGEGHQWSYKLVCIVELATYVFTYWPTFCKMWTGISQARVHSSTLLLRANPRWRCQCRFWFTLVPPNYSSRPWVKTSTHVNTMVKIPKIHLDYF
jgi:hypothetical protein